MRGVIFGVSILVLLFAFMFASSVYEKRRGEKLDFLSRENASTFVRAHSPILGDDGAKVYIVKFTDPACGTCAAFSPFVKRMMAENPGKIKLVIRYAPFHDGSDNFVRILEAARKQGKFWETLEVMYESQEHWVPNHRPQLDKIWQILPHAGLDVDRIRNDMNDPAISRIIAQDLADAKALGVRKTPGFFVNGKPLKSFGYPQLQELVRSEVIANYLN